jgi:hypothetical protein
LTVTGLQSATSYTFAVTGTNASATGAASAASSSITATTVPATMTAPTATNSGSGRAFNNGAASVAFTAPATGGSAITGYTVTSSPGSFTGTGSSSPITVTGQQSATAYTYTITATNANGTSTASSASSSVTATTVPDAPTIGTATATSTTAASVTFTAPATGGSAITGYTVTSSPGSITGTGGSSPITVSGLTTGQAYTFTVTATNANGTSNASSASNSATPDYQDSYNSIASVTPSGASFSFTNIPQNYKYLEIRMTNLRTTSSGSGLGDFLMTFNSDTGSNYYRAQFNALDVAQNAGGSVTAAQSIRSYYNVFDNGATGQNATIITLHNYSSTTEKKSGGMISGGYNVVNPTMNALNRTTLLYNSNTAISSITFVTQSGGQWNGGTVALYGITG